MRVAPCHATQSLVLKTVMIIIVLAVVLACAAFFTPWRTLSPTERAWATLSWLVAIGAFAVPTTPATSAWRAVADHALQVCLIGCAVLAVAGVLLLRARRAAGRPAAQLLPVFVVLGVPLLAVAAVGVLWFVGRSRP
jgi:hypothetical protein